MSSKRLIVMKFGGTSVGNAARVRQCAQIVSKAAQQDRIVVVVSAMFISSTPRPSETWSNACSYPLPNNTTGSSRPGR